MIVTVFYSIDETLINADMDQYFIAYNLYKDT